MRRPLLPLLAAALAVPLLGVAGCLEAFEGTSCTAIGADCGFYLTLERAGWESGARIELTADGKPYVCTLEGPELPFGCDGSGGVGLSMDGGDVRVHLEGRPRTLEVTVRADEVELFSETFRPDYEVSEPWGEDCGTCAFAEAVHQLAPPDRCTAEGGCPCVHDDGCDCGETADEPWPWVECPAGQVTPEACDPARCTCEGERPRCLSRCGGPETLLTLGADCSGGDWTCDRPGYGFREDRCP